MKVTFKYRGLVSPEKHAAIKGALEEFQKQWEEGNDIIVEADEGETLEQLKQEIEYVAKAEGVSCAITLSEEALEIKMSKVKATRMSAEESTRRILEAFEPDKEMQKKDILAKAGVSPSVWNTRIKSLIEEKKVFKTSGGYILAS